MNTTTTPTAQDNLRTGNPAPTPAYGEPWSVIREQKRSSRVIINRNGERVARVQKCSNEKGQARHKQHAHRLKVCVNACAGMIDPAKDIEAMRKAIKEAYVAITSLRAAAQHPHPKEHPSLFRASQEADAALAKLKPFTTPGA